MGRHLSLHSPSAWVLTWLRKGMEKVVPQPVHSGKPAQSTVVSLENPDQVLLGLGAAEGWCKRGCRRLVHLGSLSMPVCLSVPTGRSTDPWALQHWGLR